MGLQEISLCTKRSLREPALLYTNWGSLKTNLPTEVSSFKRCQCAEHIFLTLLTCLGYCIFKQAPDEQSLQSGFATDNQWKELHSKVYSKWANDSQQVPEPRRWRVSHGPQCFFKPVTQLKYWAYKASIPPMQVWDNAISCTECLTRQSCTPALPYLCVITWQISIACKMYTKKTLPPGVQALCLDGCHLLIWNKFFGTFLWCAAVLLFSLSVLYAQSRRSLLIFLFPSPFKAKGIPFAVLCSIIGLTKPFVIGIPLSGISLSGPRLPAKNHVLLCSYCELLSIDLLVYFWSVFWGENCLHVIDY